MSSNWYYQFQIPEAEITIYCASAFYDVDSLLVLFMVRCHCLCLSLFPFVCCFVFFFLNI